MVHSSRIGSTATRRRCACAAVAADAGLLIAFGVESAAALLDGFGVDAVLETIQGISDSGVL